MIAFLQTLSERKRGLRLPSAASWKDRLAVATSLIVIIIVLVATFSPTTLRQWAEDSGIKSVLGIQFRETLKDNSREISRLTSILNKHKNLSSRFKNQIDTLLKNPVISTQTKISLNQTLKDISLLTKGTTVVVEDARARVKLNSKIEKEIDRAPKDELGSAYGVVFSGDKKLSGGLHEIRLAHKRIGEGNYAVFERRGRYRSVRIFASRSEALKAEQQFDTNRWKDSYVVKISSWCATRSSKPYESDKIVKSIITCVE